MLPPGHLAAGYLTAKAVLRFSGGSLPNSQRNELLWWGVLFGILPDSDFIAAFIQSHSLKYAPRKGNHREFPSHAPLPWLITGFLIFLLAGSGYWKVFGLLLWLCPWSHFLVDTIQYGIMWLWPFSKQRFRLYDVINQPQVDKDMAAAMDKNFFAYWRTFLKDYSQGLRISLVCETLLVVVTLILYFHHLI